MDTTGFQPLMRFLAIGCLPLLALGSNAALAADEPLFPQALDVTPEPIASDPGVRYDYDIVYVRAPRAGDEKHKRFYTDFSQPVTLEPGADLVLLHPDGKEELLVAGGDRGSVTDPMISLDGEWVFYVLIYDLVGHNQWSPPAAGADIFKIHLKTRRIVRLTNQVFTPNAGAGDWSSDGRADRERPEKNHYAYGVFNMGPCPLPGGRLVFTSNRDGLRPAKGYPAVALQLFVIDDADDGDVDARDPYPRNIEKIGHLNLAGALHPVVLADGRILFSTLESQGVRSDISWGIWTIHPDGTRWAPAVSAFDPGGASNGFHFQTQLSDGSLVIEEYYNQNNSGFGAFIKMPAQAPAGEPAFGPAHMGDPRNPRWRFGRFDNGKGKWYQMPFKPSGSISMTPFALNGEGPADRSVLGDKSSPAVGKVTHPSSAPDNHMLLVWSPGPVNHQYTYLPQLDGGIYLLKDGKAIEEPGALLLIKNDPHYNECWPRAVVPYRRIYGIDEPARLEPLANDGSRSPLLPAGTPFGLVGSSSLYKRESYPNGAVPEGEVTARYAGRGDPWKGLDPFTSHGFGMPLNWHNQGADAGLYENSEIHAVRILVMEPTTDRHRGARSGRRFFNHAQERLRILGEIPVRKFKDGGQPRDPDGNPDTSFLARIPADTAFTFQTIDREGMVLNMSQTWHQLRPGEVRNDCGGCHAHSQRPTEFAASAAARPDYQVWDLTRRAPLVTEKSKDASGKRWDAEDRTGLRFAESEVADVEYFREVQPILKRSCIACHTKAWKEPAGKLVLDDDESWIQVDHHGKFPGTYVRLAMDEKASFGHKPVTYDSWGYPNASRYVRKLQSRRSLLMWKVHGRRLDGFSNDDHPSEPEPGAGHHVHRGERYDKRREWYDIDYLGSPMPPPEAVAGTYQGPDGQSIRVEPLADEDRRTLARWIDLGCPVDLDRGPGGESAAGAGPAAAPKPFGWFCDDNRPIVALTLPPAIDRRRILLGLHDYYSSLDEGSLRVRADFALAGAAPGADLAPRFKAAADGVWALDLDAPFAPPPGGRLEVEVKDRQGNEAKVVKIFPGN
jgi:hypothetical protein